ncbi:AAA family ATPase [Saccharibacillus qingshengii]|uniref:AAA family ATPase n=1 Tax=Saccharibacillus qingshengii TaxID=1763540 RepID=UPI0015547BB6|nr:AAA family ATPase [Saccharibacillus qingshengii]
MDETGIVRREQFIEWMKSQKQPNGNPYAPGTIRSYASALAGAAGKLEESSALETTNLFEIGEYDRYMRVKAVITAAEGFEEIDRKAQTQDFTQGLKYYGEFLADKENAAMTESARPDYSEGTPLDKNIILYGPPGTGKTYHTVIYAVAMIEKRSLQDVLKEAEAEDGYEKVKARYEEYKAAGQIVFTTFHQSYGYEEFMEGIKPVMVNGEEAGADSGDVSYKIESGIFKKFCETAANPLVKTDNDYGIRQNPVIWKISLGGAGDNPIKRDGFVNGRIRIGWDGYGADGGVSDQYADGGKTTLNAFMNEMRKGDLVLVLHDRETIDAIGVVTGDYEWLDELDQYKRSRSVKWLVKEIKEDIMDLNGGAALTALPVYRLNRIGLEDILAILGKHPGPNPDSVARENPNNYVFIIDEVNRGNISKIFGELITLIEPSKRLGKPEEITLKLPYSSQPFGVPDNVYLLATMNTADRSIARLDTALRRRFTFAEMMPQPKLLSSLKIKGTELNPEKMLEIINRRIEALYDREHMLGHAYFLGLKNEPTLEKLAQLFEHAVIPLLQEYFYDDYEKIRLVLGDNRKADEQDRFIAEVGINANDLFGSGGDRYVDERRTYRINPEAFKREEAYLGIYANPSAANGSVQP